jgi:hypothetical protein
MEAATVRWLEQKLTADDAKLTVSVFPQHNIWFLHDMELLSRDDLAEAKLPIGARNRVWAVIETFQKAMATARAARDDVKFDPNALAAPSRIDEQHAHYSYDLYDGDPQYLESSRPGRAVFWSDRDGAPATAPYDSALCSELAIRQIWAQMTPHLVPLPKDSPPMERNERLLTVRSRSTRPPPVTLSVCLLTHPSPSRSCRSIPVVNGFGS